MLKEKASMFGLTSLSSRGTPYLFDNSGLSQLQCKPKEVKNLSSRTRTRLLKHLLRWHAYADALECLKHLEVNRYVTLQDFHARALVGLERPSEATQIVRGRLKQKRSKPAEILLGRCLLASREHSSALTLAQEFTTQHPNSSMGWGLLADIYCNLEQWEDAKQSYLNAQQVAPLSREPALGLMKVYQHYNDLITAVAYAVRAFHVEDNETPPSVEQLKNLRNFFSETQETHRYNEATKQLQRRHHSELEQLQEEIADELQRDPHRPSPPRTSRNKRSFPIALERHTPPIASLPSLQQIPVSEEEQSTLEQAVYELFGYTSLKEAQPQIMASSLRGEDVLAILPTGAGKSLCYQLPGMLNDGVTLIISPLIALMKDQVDSLPQIVQRQTIALNSSMSSSAVNQAINQIAQGRYKLVYVAPERLRQLPFLHALRYAGVARFVIDEAHCISVWGHDFRPDYLYIKRVHQDLGSPPILAMTATAPPLVRQDIERQLFPQTQTRSFQLIMTDIYRPNLRLQVLRAAHEDEKLRHLLGLCQQMNGSGIIYARTRRHCEQLATLLRNQGFSAAHYHAGIPNRAQIQNRFMANEIQIIVATIAFGMGVDKSDIRFIIHYGLPKSVEAYYQEAGRAGRDGQPAHCVLLYTNSDKGTLTRHAREGAIPIEFLRKVYATVRHWLRESNPNTITQDELIRTLNSDDTTVRVSLSILERAGLLTRHYDAPHSVTIYHHDKPGSDSWQRFTQAVVLHPKQRTNRRFIELATDSKIPPSKLELQLLEWQTEGWVYLESHSRDLLLELPPPPSDASTRIKSLLDQYATIQEQRVIEISDYGRTYHCRHGYLASYLGSVSRTSCNMCDNCYPDQAFDRPDYELPPVNEQMLWALRSLQGESWERSSLKALLRGDPYCGPFGQHSSAFGKIGYRSNTAVGKLLDRLIDAKLIAECKQHSGKWHLSLTPEGKEAIQSPEALNKA